MSGASRASATALQTTDVHSSAALHYHLNPCGTGWMAAYVYSSEMSVSVHTARAWEARSRKTTESVSLLRSDQRLTTVPIRTILLLLAAAFVPSLGSAQAPPSALPLAFEVATIKPSKAVGWRLQPTPNGYTATGVTLRMLVQEAYGVYDVSSSPAGQLGSTQTSSTSKRSLTSPRVPNGTASPIASEPICSSRFSPNASTSKSTTR